MIDQFTKALIIFLLVGIFGSMIGMVMMHQDIVENRQIGCVSRYLDGQQYAPECKVYIKHFKRQ